MATRRPWYDTLFRRDYFDLFYVGGVFTPEQIEQQAERQVEFVVNALELAEGARVLDLCCGWGRHSVRLAQHGFRVTGLDLSAYHLRLAQAAARKAGVEVEWVRADMRDVPRGRRFDAVINMFTSFGYFETEAEDQKVLDGVARALRPGGRFFIDTINHDGLMRVFRETDWQQRTDGSITTERRRYDVRTGRMNNEWTHIAADGKRRRHSFSHRLYTFTELAAMLSKAGLRVVSAWGNFDGSELTMSSPRIIALAERR
jgi:cyclopropane fatty-acyl-phospholipid synthase-like methyltransferase